MNIYDSYAIIIEILIAFHNAGQFINFLKYSYNDHFYTTQLLLYNHFMEC